MATIITRETGATAKGSPLTNAEVDNNFINLNAEVSPARPTVRPTLNLDFSNSESFESRLEFSRASGATYFNEQGLIATKRNNQPRIEFDPITGECRGFLVEEQRTNLLTNASDIVSDGSSFSVNGCIRPIKASVISPSGLMDAYKIMENGSNARHETNFTNFAVGVNNTYVVSVYAKAAERNFLELSFGGYPSASFNLNTGVTVNNGTQVSGYPKMTSVGNGWYKCEFAWLATSSNSNSSIYLGIEQAAGGYVANQGIAGYGLYIWGAQVELAGFSTSYIPSTTSFSSRASSATYLDKDGIVRIAGNNQPRYNYVYDILSGKPISQGLLLEASATNLISNYNSNLYADYFGAEAFWTSIVGSSQDVTAPDGSSRTTKGVSGTSGNSFFWRYSPASYSTNTVYTHSVWIRCATGQGTAAISLSSLYQSKAVTVTEQWQRFELTFDTGALGSGQPYVAVVSPQANKTFYFWGWQVELGGAATSYIPTFGSAVTRAADVSTTAGATRSADLTALTKNYSWYNQNFTLVGEGDSISGTANVGGAPVLVAIDDGTGNNRMQLRRHQSGGDSGSSASGFVYRVAINPAGGGSYSIDGPINTAYLNKYWQDTAKHKTAMSITTNSQIFAGDGVSTTSASITAPTIPVVRRIWIGYGDGGRYWNGHISKITFYPRTSTAAQLQALTQ